ncbi:radical SAM protein [uncultured Arcticibacterium sp.]|uniref:B12-binding domain-containing radical SAM protein n=1 Tax=uncultured Arcticibacterium sp. TaxID=2173042 RepID=UPI0030F50389
MKHRIVLYNPKAEFYTMPLALVAIASYLDPTLYEVIIIDGRLEDEPVKRLSEALRHNAVCFGTTVLTGSIIKDALLVSKLIKEKFADLPVIWGGWHASLFPEETLSESCIDVVVRGQGEMAFAELVERLLAKESLAGLKGVSFKENGKIVANPERTMMDINKFPAFNYDLIPVKDYVKLSGRKQLDYISSQGCRFRCTFCADPFVYNRGWYGYSPERVGDEIEALWNKYQFEHIHFQDETYFTNKKRVAGIAQEFIDRKLPISWFATMRADQGFRLEDDVWELCKKSGLEKVMIGVEAGSQEMLDWMKKDIKIEQVFACAEKCLKYDIAINFSAIVGFPDETDASINETIRIAKELRKMSSKFQVAVFYFKPYPGNEIADLLTSRGFEFPVGLSGWANFDYVGSVESDWISNQKIKEIEGFKFYQQLGYSEPTFLKAIPQKMARWRVENSFYAFQFEKKIIRWLKPQKELS